ncbi:MAG TPA: hypothetical protein VKQ32_26120 [Polyangia bacterium]|nr:hypothetical protein [Polyangia bacterium]
MTTRRKWVLGSIAFMLAVLAVAGYTLETRYAMGQMGEVVFPWQKARRRLRAARVMTSGEGSRFVKFRVNDDPGEREARVRRNGAICDKLTGAWTDYFVRCLEPKDPERPRVRAELQDLVSHAVAVNVSVCSEAQADTIGPPDEQVDSCIAFFTSGMCDLLDYAPDELAISTMDVMIKKPNRPQPHIEACPFLFL